MRESMKWFTKEMEKVLKANDHKGSWEDEDIEYLWNRLTDEKAELRKILVKSETMESNIPIIGYKEKIIRECCDVANFAMMIADRIKY